jgi:phosphatidylglycerol:prolipoprotein diacylglycerol transferase
MILFDFKQYWNDPGSLFTLSTLQAAGVYQGGFLLALVTAIIYMRRNRLPSFETCDVFAPGVAAGQAIGRLGCFAAGCCWGTECDRPWAVTFESLDAHDLTNVPLGVPLHPAQLYEVGADALIFSVLYWMIGREHRTGTIIAWYLTLYSCVRIVIEFFRFHEQGLHYGLSWTQWISVGTLIAGLGLLFLRRGAAKVS